MEIYFDHPVLKDLSAIMQIENAGFSPEEAATERAMKERILMIPDSFILAKNAENEILGYVVRPIIKERLLYDDLFESISSNPKINGYQSILSLAISSQYQGMGIATKLLKELSLVCKEAQREGITLTCLEHLIPFYQKSGYHLEGRASSQHAGEVWYDMVLDLRR